MRARTRVRLCGLALGAVLLGCGGSRAIAPTLPSAPATLSPRHVGEREVLVAQRPMGEDVAVTVWIDAGTLDGGSTALVAAELVARALPEARSLVTPDGTRFSRICARAQLEACVAELASALGGPAVDEERVLSARREVEARRVRGLASSRREAETLAVSAALGLELTPLGDSEDVVRTEDVTRFLERHYGGDRTLWVVVGEVSESDAQRAIERASQRDATSARAARTADESAPRTRASEGTDTGHWAIAWRAEDESDARARARAWSARAALVPELSVSSFPMRGGWVALASFRASERGDRGALTRLVAAPPIAAPLAALEDDVDDDAWTLADRLGARWVAGEPRVSARLGVALAGRDAEAERSSLDEAGALGASSTELTVAHRIVVPHAPLSIVGRFAGGALDGSASLGATVIATELLGHCVEGAIESSPEAVYVRAHGEGAWARAALWADCVAMWTPSDEAIEDARRVLVARASLEDARRTVAASLLAPTQPGAITGDRVSREALSDVPAEDVRRRWISWRDEDAAWIAVGDASVVEGLAEHARPRTHERLELVRDEAPSEPTHLRLEVAETELLVASGLEGCGSEAAAEALRDAWTRQARARGAQVLWQASGASVHWAWGAIAIRGEASTLEAIATSSLDEGARPALREAARTDRGRVGATGTALGLAARALEGDPQLRCEGAPIVRRAWLEPLPRSGRR